MDCVILVDNSNIYIEGQKCSAVRKGVIPVVPGEKQPCDPSWRIDFGRLLGHLANGRDIRAAILVGSRPPPNDAVWQMAERSGFKVITHDRDADNKEKAVDTEIVAQGTLLLAQTPAPAVLVIGSGDRDFLPLVNVAHQLTWTVEMAAFVSAFSGQMAMAVDKVCPLDSALDHIGHNAFDWPPQIAIAAPQPQP
ncbi:MAG: NYN domain-containing protein [Methyloceanibacter sp.]